MRKFFILTLMVASLLMVSCVERRNRVILDKFIPIPDTCEIKAGGDTYQTEGKIDLAFTFDYLLAFQITNYIPSSEGGGSGSSLTTAEANYFYSEKVELEYEWDPRPQADGRKLTLDQKLWNKKTRKTVYPIVVNPNGGQAAGWVHIFEEAQAKNLLEHVNDIDWIASPLIIKVKVIGELADGTTVETNKMKFNIIPTFGTSVQMGSAYPVPEGDFQDTTDANGNKVSAAQNEYDTIMSFCAFNDPLLNGCLYGQDSALVNCYAGDTEWERYIADKNGYSQYTGYAAMDVVEMVYNTVKKVAGDTNYYKCCPGEAPEAPEEEDEEEDSANAAAGGE